MIVERDPYLEPFYQLHETLQGLCDETGVTLGMIAERQPAYRKAIGEKIEAMQMAHLEGNEGVRDRASSAIAAIYRKAAGKITKAA